MQKHFNMPSLYGSLCCFVALSAIAISSIWQSKVTLTATYLFILNEKKNVFFTKEKILLRSKKILFLVPWNISKSSYDTKSGKKILLVTVHRFLPLNLTIILSVATISYLKLILKCILWQISYMTTYYIVSNNIESTYLLFNRK